MLERVKKHMLKPAMRYSHDLLLDCIETGDVVVDATMGNGHDTLFLAELVGPTGHVFGFDIQEQAYTATLEKITAADCLKQTTLCLTGHEHLGLFIPLDTPIKAAIFNLGYLPKGDKTLVTTKDTTLKAVEELLMRLVPKGRIILVLYDGHDEGKPEKSAVLTFVSQLDQTVFSVMHYQFLNQKNNPPSLVCIEKKTT